MNPEKVILGLFKQWNAALQTGDADEVLDCYAETAVLLPTLSDEVRSTPARIRAYFAKEFLPKKPSGKLDEHHVRLFGGLAINSGIYTFRFAAGGVGKAQARYTFVYQWIEDQWLIVEHHSSLMPEG